jgi:hypothetical protein
METVPRGDLNYNKNPRMRDSDLKNTPKKERENHPDRKSGRAVVYKEISLTGPDSDTIFEMVSEDR